MRSKIGLIVKNFRKDSTTWKSIKYCQVRLDIWEIICSELVKTDKKLRKAIRSYDYFTTDNFVQMKSFCVKYSKFCLKKMGNLF